MRPELPSNQGSIFALIAFMLVGLCGCGAMPGETASTTLIDRTSKFSDVAFLTFTPSSTGKQVVITITASAPDSRVTAQAGEGTTILASQQFPSENTTMLNFNAQNTNVHYVSLVDKTHFNDFPLTVTYRVLVVEN